MILDLDRLETSPLRRDPFDFVLVDNFIRVETLPALLADFPPCGDTAAFRSARFRSARRSPGSRPNSKATRCATRSSGNSRSIWRAGRR